MHLYLKGHGLKETKIRSNDILKSSLGLHFRQTQNNSILNGTGKWHRNFDSKTAEKESKSLAKKLYRNVITKNDFPTRKLETQIKYLINSSCESKIIFKFLARKFCLTLNMRHLKRDLEFSGSKIQKLGNDNTLVLTRKLKFR